MEKYTIVRNNNTINAILRRVSKLNNCKGELYASKWHYIERTVVEDNCHFFRFKYKGELYSSKYFDGCFKPFVIKHTVKW